MKTVDLVAEVMPDGKLVLEAPRDMEPGRQLVKLTYEDTAAKEGDEPQAARHQDLYLGIFTTPPHDVPLSDPNYRFSRDQIYEDEEIDLR